MTIEQLCYHATLLDIIEQRRIATNDPDIGWAIEQHLIEAHLREIELSEGEDTYL